MTLTKPFWKTSKFKRLQKVWYGKAKRSGHRDIERWVDLNDYPASTLPTEHPGNKVSFRSIETYNPDAGVAGSEASSNYDYILETAEYHAPHETPTAQAWRKFSIEVESLSRRDDRRPLLRLIAADGRVSKRTLRSVGMRRGDAMRIVRRFLAEIGLPVRGMLGKGG